MNGRALKQKLMQLMREHRVAPIVREPLPLLPSVVCSQIAEGYAATSDVDSDRMSFLAGSLIWDDLGKIPLLVRHSDKVAGKLLSLDYRPDGRLLVRAQVDDPEARNMPAFSVAATVIEFEVRDEASACFHFVIRKAVLDHVAITDRPANAFALVTSRRDVTAADATHDAVLAAATRARKALDDLREAWSKPATTSAAKIVTPRVFTRDLAPASGLIYGPIPAALLKKPRTSFGEMVARLPLAGEP